MKAVKFLFKALVAVLVLVVLAVVGLMIFVDPNDFKPQIEQAVVENTGRELTIDGDISWAFWPRFGLNIGHTELSNADGYTARVFAEIDEVDVGIQVLPLLKGAVEADVIYLDGLVANLEVKSSGKTNWDDFVEADGRPASVKEGPRAATVNQGDQATGLASLPPIRLGGIHVRDAQVNYSDLSGGMAAMLEDFNFKTGPIVLWEPISFEGDFTIENKYPELLAEFDYSGVLTAKVLDDKFALNDFKLGLKAQGEPVPNGSVSLSLAADVSADTAAETAELAKLQIKLDETTIDGKASVKGFSEPAIDFDVAVDKLNVDHYLPEPEEAPEPTAWEEEAPEPVDTDPKIELPLVMLRGLDMDGKLTVGELQVMGLKTSDIEAVLSAHQGIIHLKPMKVALYDGRFNGSVRLDATGRIPSYAVKSEIKGVQVQPLLTDFAQFDTVAGSGNIQLDITTRGERVSELKRGLNGNLSLAFADGSIQGDIRGKIDKWAELIGQKDELYGEGGETTTFKTLDASATVVDGKLVTNDLNMESGNMTIAGDGSFDIPTEYLDFVYTLRVDEYSCPIGIEGQLMEIDYAKAAKNAVPDCVKGMLDARLDAEKEKLKRELEAKKAEAEARLEAEKAKAKAKLEAEKAKAKAELERKKAEEKKKLEDKAKEELNKLLDF